MRTTSSKVRATAVGIVSLLLLASGVGLWTLFGPILTRHSTVTRIHAGPYEAASRARPGRFIVPHCAACHGVTRLEGQPELARAQARRQTAGAAPRRVRPHLAPRGSSRLFRPIQRLGVKPPLAPEGYQSDMPAFGGVVLTDDQHNLGRRWRSSRAPGPRRSALGRHGLDEAAAATAGQL